MNADFLAVLEFWEREKGISRDVLIAAVEESIQMGEVGRVNTPCRFSTNDFRGSRFFNTVGAVALR